MSVDLTIGLLQAPVAWGHCLSRLGLSWRSIDHTSELRPGDYAVIICDDVPADGGRALLRYLEAGGAILDSGFMTGRLAGGGITTRSAKTIFPDPASTIFGTIPLIDIFAPVRIFQGESELDGLVTIQTAGKGHLAFWGVDLPSLLSDTRQERKQFYAGTGERLPNEQVSLVSKGALLECLEALLKSLFYRRGLPYLHLNRFPGAAPSIFAMRIDSDFSTREELRAHLDLAVRYQMRMSWFLHVEAHQEWLHELRLVTDQEWAVHCYRHHTYPDYPHNRDDLQLACREMDRAGLPYRGHAAPYGIWNPARDRAANEAGFAYSSEFGIDYDNLPEIAGRATTPSTLMQIPVHPVCPGSLERARFTIGEMSDYFLTVARDKLQRRQPLIFYDHPGHAHLPALEELFRFARDSNLPNMTLAEYGDWWHRRGQSAYRATFTEGRLSVDWEQSVPETNLCIQQEGRVVRIPAATEITLSELSWQPAPEISTPPDIQRVRDWSLSLPKQDLLDRYWRYRNLRKQEKGNK